MRFCPSTVVFCLFAAGCVGTGSGAARPTSDPPTAQNQSEITEEAMTLAEETASFRVLLERALTAPDLSESLESDGRVPRRDRNALDAGLG